MLSADRSAPVKRRNVQEAFVGEPTGDPTQSLENYAEGDEAVDIEARVVRSQAEKILATPRLLPKVHRAAYKRMLRKFIIVANLLQPGPGYGTTPQDYAAWYDAMRASTITVW